LQRSLSGERIACEVKERHVALARASLDRPLEQLATDALQLLADLDRSGFEVDVRPAQAERLTTPKSVKDEQQESCIERIGPGNCQELLGLVRRPGTDGTALPFW
jgi:hypothetical protein